MADALYLSKLNVNGQEYQIKDANAVSDSRAESLLASKVGYGEYDSTNQLIKFYDIEDERSRTQLFSIDATDFIKDGMVSDVAISNGNLVITFNTDAGHNAISIPLTDIFNPANYYDKTAMDAALALKADASNVYTKSEADGKFLTEHQSLANYPTIETMNTALGQKANVSDIYTQTEIDNKLAAKANSADLATVATSGSYDDLTDKPVIPEGVIVDAALSDVSENAVQNKVVKAAIDAAKAYYISFATIATTGITDEDWDGIVAAIDAHRPIYAGYPQGGGILYYGVECMNKNSNNTQIILISSDDSSHYFYTFTKNGSNDYSYTVETRPYTTQDEKDAWNAKQDAISDLATIRSGAALGATALQSYTETDPVFTASAAHGITAQDITAWNAKSDFSGSYNDLTDKPTIPTQTTVSVTGETLYISTNEL